MESSVFLLTSLEEGVPRTILEAMACGRPVICTALIHLINIVSECGLLIPIKDAGAVADALSELASDPALAHNLGQAARAKVVSQYSWDDTVAKTLVLYASLIRPIQGGNEPPMISKTSEKSLKFSDAERIDG